jgi:hypothetical protein
MHRIAALLVLLVFGLSQAAAAECPMASASGGGARHPAAAHLHHHAHPHSTGGSHAPAHGQLACGLAMSCGAAAAVSAGAVVTQPPIRLAALPKRLPHLYASPILNTDSPPPRA